MKKPYLKYKKFIISVLGVSMLVLIFTLLISLSTIPILLFSIFLFCMYLLIIHFIYKLLDSNTKNDISAAILLYTLIAIIFIIFSGMIADSYKILTYSSNDNYAIDLYDSIYWASTTFTTLGYGDFLPNRGGRVLSMSISIIGSIHMVTLMSIILFKLSKLESIKK